MLLVTSAEDVEVEGCVVPAVCRDQECEAVGDPDQADSSSEANRLRNTVP